LRLPEHQKSLTLGDQVAGLLAFAPEAMPDCKLQHCDWCDSLSRTTFLGPLCFSNRFFFSLAIFSDTQLITTLLRDAAFVEDDAE